MNTRKEQILSLAIVWSLLDDNRSWMDSGNGWVEFYHHKKGTDRIVVASLYYEGSYLTDSRDATPCLELLQDAYGNDNIDILRITRDGNAAVWWVFDTNDLPEPDYSIASSDVSRIDCVREAVEYLLSKQKNITTVDIPAEFNNIVPVSGQYVKSGGKFFYTGPFVMPENFKVPQQKQELANIEKRWKKLYAAMEGDEHGVSPSWVTQCAEESIADVPFLLNIINQFV